MSRDLDSPLTVRERAAVDAWMNSNKSFHVMRDNPDHATAMLAGMWGFKPSLDSNMSLLIHNKIHTKILIEQYRGVNDQTFLSFEVWPYAKSSVIVHDSFFCTNNYGHPTLPFPTQRLPPYETNCYIGCVRPCCEDGKLPFNACPTECRPQDHKNWTYC